MSALTSMGAGELAAAIKGKKASASEVIDAHLALISEKDASIGAFLARADDAARGAAKEIDARIARFLADRAAPLSTPVTPPALRCLTPPQAANAAAGRAGPRCGATRRR